METCARFILSEKGGDWMIWEYIRVAKRFTHNLVSLLKGKNHLAMVVDYLVFVY